MSKLESIKHTLRKHKPELARRYRVREVGVFGSSPFKVFGVWVEGRQVRS